MLHNAETLINQGIGRFSTIPQLYTYATSIDSYSISGQYNGGILPDQCRAFIVSSTEFVWFVEAYDVVESALGSDPEVPKITLENKRIYPAKVSGINLASLVADTITWREGVINSTNRFSSSIAFRPGFGQTILSDLSRPVKSVSVLKNDLGLATAVVGQHFAGSLGRLMSIAVKVDKTKAALYDASQKKKKSLNSQDYEQIPTYPTYDIYSNTGGY